VYWVLPVSAAIPKEGGGAKEGLKASSFSIAVALAMAVIHSPLRFHTGQSQTNYV